MDGCRDDWVEAARLGGREFCETNLNEFTPSPLTFPRSPFVPQAALVPFRRCASSLFRSRSVCHPSSFPKPQFSLWAPLESNYGLLYSSTASQRTLIGRESQTHAVALLTSQVLDCLFLALHLSLPLAQSPRLDLQLDPSVSNLSPTAASGNNCHADLTLRRLSLLPKLGLQSERAVPLRLVSVGKQEDL